MVFMVTPFIGSLLRRSGALEDVPPELDEHVGVVRPLSVRRLLAPGEDVEPEGGRGQVVDLPGELRPYPPVAELELVEQEELADQRVAGEPVLRQVEREESLVVVAQSLEASVEAEILVLVAVRAAVVAGAGVEDEVVPVLQAREDRPLEVIAEDGLVEAEEHAPVVGPGRVA